MKTIFKTVLLAIPAAMLAGCAAPVYVEKDDSVNLSDYKTYQWVNTQRNEQDKQARSSAYADIAVHNAVNAELKNIGWRETDEDPDILLSYDILVERTTEQQRDPVYSQGFTRMYYNPYRRRWGTIYYPSQFLGYDVYDQPVKQGTVTITMMDARSDKNVRQGWTTERLDYAKITSEEVSASVHNIFRKFDVARR